MQATLLSRHAPTSIDAFEDKRDILRTLITLDMLHLLIIGGPGTGKSTLSRLIVLEYYGKAPHVKDNVLVINSLKEQGVQYYRTEVRNFCQTRCTIPSKKKIITIDDIDVIQEHGQQVFLNCIDLYGGNVNYIVTGSAPQKIVENIHSRLVCLKLNAFSQDYLRSILHRVTAAEGISVDEEAAPIIVTRCNKSIRTLINYVEKFRLLGSRVTVDTADRVCSNINDHYMHSLYEHIAAKETRAAIQLVHQVYSEGYSVMDILDAFFNHMKNAAVNDSVKYPILKIICKYIVVFNQVHEHPIELNFFVNDLVLGH